MFNLQSQAAKLVHINVREEKHGDEPVPAIDLKISADLQNTFLSQLHPTLCWSLYDKSPSHDLVDDTHMPVLRYKAIEPVRWKGDIKEALITLVGAPEAGNIEFVASVSKLVLECLEGGTVRIGFMVQAVVDAHMIGQLAGLLGQDIEISVVPPAPVVDDVGERKARMRSRKTRKSAAGHPNGNLLQ